MQMNGSFNANQFDPNQGGGGGHPPAQKIPFTITSTSIKENKSKDGGFFEVELTSQLGTQIARYNVWNTSAKAVEIAHGQLSALCRAVNIYNLDWQNEGAALRGGRGLMDIGYQKGEEPTAEKPQGGYTELKKVYDAAGNEPGKAPAQAQPQVQQNAPQTNQQQPMQQQPGGGWSNQAPQGQANPAPSNGGWQGGQPQQAQPQQQAAPQQIPSAPNGQAWQPGIAGPNTAPPWGQR